MAMSSKALLVKKWCKANKTETKLNILIFIFYSFTFASELQHPMQVPVRSSYVKTQLG